MKAFHSFWSRPNITRNPEGVIELPDFELLTTILSALQWKCHNGPIKLITDTPGYQYFTRMGLSGLWDEVELTLDAIDEGIDPFLFWAAGKLYALRQMEAPCVMLDTDLIIWKNVDVYCQGDVTAAHPEDLNPYVYPDHRTFRLKEGYAFPESWDFTVPAANTAFLYLKDAAFKEYYVRRAIEVFENIRIEGLNPVTAMCFAEQRVLPMCAAEKGMTMDYLISLDQAETQDIATHTWGFKQLMREIPRAREEFCMRCVRKLLTEFPEKETLLKTCPPLKKYLGMYREQS